MSKQDLFSQSMHCDAVEIMPDLRASTWSPGMLWNASGRSTCTLAQSTVFESAMRCPGKGMLHIVFWALTRANGG